MKREGYDKNIIQIWEDIGKKVPFAVQRWTWADNSCAIVYNVEVEKYPYGKCYGFFVRNGQIAQQQIYRNNRISCDGCYQWKLTDGPNEEIRSLVENFLSKKRRGR